MKLFVDRNRLYLVLVYFSLSFFYLSFILDGMDDPVPLLGYILAFIVVIVTSHDALLRIISQATGQLTTSTELDYFSAFIELNRKMHNFLEVDDVLTMVRDTLRQKVQLHNIVFLIASEVVDGGDDLDDMEEGRLLLRSWPDQKQWQFHTLAFEEEVTRRGRLFTRDDSDPVLANALDETETSFMLPIVQNGKVLCIILAGRTDAKPYTEFEYQMFDYLANQLSIILDRIRVYAKVMHQTAMDHAEKLQVMQSLSANIAHEMRTPLSGIRASISGIEEYLPQLMASHEWCARNAPQHAPMIREGHLGILQTTPRRIKLMIDQANTVIDMLLMNLRDNSFDRRQLNPIDAADIIEQAVDRYPFKSGEREKLHLELDDDFTFLGVESLCIYIFFNLLKNAYYSMQSAQKGDITIRLETAGRLNHIIFRDTGTGIDSSIIGRIFDGFFTTKSDGTGAGLAFCKRTILSFGGEISCDSIAGEFTEFRISLSAFEGMS
jgi:signal transduction histidine kinase